MKRLQESRRVEISPYGLTRGAELNLRSYSTSNVFCSNRMKRILKEPLLHFLLLGAAIFAAYSLVSKRSSDEPGKIVLTQGQIAALAEPTDDELDAFPPCPSVERRFGA